MKNKLLKLLFTTLLTTSCLANADGIVEQKSSKQTPFIEYHNRLIVIAPLRVGYERIKPRSLYVGIDELLMFSYAREKTALIEAEFRMGYNFFYNGRDHVTPIVGIGYVQDLKSEAVYHSNGFYDGDHKKPGIIYGTLGLFYDHEFNSVFNLGLNGKALLGGPDSRKHFDWGSYVVGYDLSLPITFRFGHHRHWDFRLEPFNLYLHGEKAAFMYFGGRSTFGYRF